MGNVNYPAPNVVKNEAGTDAIKITGQGTTAAPTLVTIAGNLNVTGETTTVQSTTAQIDDKNIELAVVDTPTDTTANGGGITLKGATDKTIVWDSTNANWTSSEHWNLPTGKSFKINNVAVLSSGALGAGVAIASSSAVAATGTAAGSPAFTFVGDTDTGMYSPSADTLRFATGGSHAATITSSGNIGIGTTSPTQALHVDTSNDGEGILALNGATGAAFEAKWISGTGNGYQLKLDDNTNATSVFLRSYGDCYFNTGGNIGIGTAAPTYTLDVVPVSASALRIKGSTDGVDVNCAIENTGTSATDDTLLSMTTAGGAGDPTIRFAIAGNETWSMGIDNSDGDKFKFSQSSTLHTDTRITLQGNKVGIGTDSPATTLDVSGTLKVSGATTLNAVAYTWPTADGSSGQQLTTDGSGVLSWSASGSGGSGGISNVVEDTTPQLGGNLDCNSKIVTGAKIQYDLGTYSTSVDTSTSDIKGVYLINADTTSAVFTLPSATSFGSGAEILVKNTNSTNDVTLKTGGGTIDGTAASTGVVLVALASIVLICDGTNFHIF